MVASPQRLSIVGGQKAAEVSLFGGMGNGCVMLFGQQWAHRNHLAFPPTTRVLVLVVQIDQRPLKAAKGSEKYAQLWRRLDSAPSQVFFSSGFLCSSCFPVLCSFRHFRLLVFCFLIYVRVTGLATPSQLFGWSSCDLVRVNCHICRIVVVTEPSGCSYARLFCVFVCVSAFVFVNFPSNYFH